MEDINIYLKAPAAFIERFVYLVDGKPSIAIDRLIQAMGFNEGSSAIRANEHIHFDFDISEVIYTKGAKDPWDTTSSDVRCVISNFITMVEHIMDMFSIYPRTNDGLCQFAPVGYRQYAIYDMIYSLLERSNTKWAKNFCSMKADQIAVQLALTVPLELLESSAYYKYSPNPDIEETRLVYLAHLTETIVTYPYHHEDERIPPNSVIFTNNTSV